MAHPAHASMAAQLCVKDIAEAIAFYQQAFGAKEAHRLVEPGGKIIHAGIVIGEVAIELAGEKPESYILSPQSLGGSPVVIVLNVEDTKDVDSMFNRAIAAGARTLFPVNDHFYGDRAGRMVDPFGHMWSIAAHREDVSPEERQRRFDAGLKQ